MILYAYFKIWRVNNSKNVQSTLSNAGRHNACSQIYGRSLTGGPLRSGHYLFHSLA